MFLMTRPTMSVNPDSKLFFICLSEIGSWSFSSVSVCSDTSTTIMRKGTMLFFIFSRWWGLPIRKCEEKSQLFKVNYSKKKKLTI